MSSVPSEKQEAKCNLASCYLLLDPAVQLQQGDPDKERVAVCTAGLLSSMASISLLLTAAISTAAMVWTAVVEVPDALNYWQPCGWLLRPETPTDVKLLENKPGVQHSCEQKVVKRIQA